MDSLVTALARAAKDTREERGISKEAVAAKLGSSADKIRYFENGRAFKGLDELLAAYAETADVSVFDLLDEAKANLRKSG